MVDVEEAIDRIPAFTSLVAHLEGCLESRPISVLPSICLT